MCSACKITSLQIFKLPLRPKITTSRTQYHRHQGTTIGSPYTSQKSRLPKFSSSSTESMAGDGIDEVHILTARLKEAGQQHVLEHWNELSPDQRRQLVQDIKEFDFQFVNRVFNASVQPLSTHAAGEQLRPCKSVLKLTDGTAADRDSWRKRGLEMIAQGQVAVLLLAGGQGTRLGSDQPKGCYDIGLPSHKSLFQLQAERLRQVEVLAAQHLASSSGQQLPVKPLRWIIMTSPFTHEATLQHFEQHSYFGLKKEQITFFQQGSLPCLTEEGKVILSTTHSIAKAPDGNGGVYLAMHTASVLDMLQREGVVALDCYCVDNALARLADPLFIGYCASQQAQVGARVVAKAFPEEKVGVFAHRGSSTCVIEYSELPADQASAADPTTGELLFNWSNICMHYFTVEWLQQVCTYLQQGCAYHVARKKIPSKDGPVQGIKLELFIFDTFPTAQRLSLMEVDRDAEFAPVKNAAGSATDTPEAARDAVLRLGAQWVRAAGGHITAEDGEVGVEVSPLVSYAGEGLDQLVSGKNITAPLDTLLQGSNVATAM